jgi:CHAT domain-containing protein
LSPFIAAALLVSGGGTEAAVVVEKCLTLAAAQRAGLQPGAQLALIRGRMPGGAGGRDRSHPFHWAAFQLIGNWR